MQSKFGDMQQPDLAKFILFFACLFAAVILVAPIGALFYSDILLTAVANESLSYRFFYSWRLIGEGGDILLHPQGHLLTAIQNIFQSLSIGLNSPSPTSLLIQLEAFGYFTLSIAVVMICALFMFVARTPTIPISSRLLIVAVVVWGFYGSRSGISALVTPDYYSFEVIITGFALLFFARQQHAELTISLRGALGLGAFAAIATGVKISLLPTAVIPVWIVVHRVALLRQRWFRLGIAFGLGYVLMLLVILLTYFWFNFSDVTATFRVWANFINAPGGEESFWVNLFASQTGIDLVGAAYSYALVIVPVAVGLTIYLFVRAYKLGRVADSALIGMLLISSAIAIYFVVHRPAGTTLWESSVHVSAAVAAALIVMNDSKSIRFLTYILTGLLTILSLISAVDNFPKVVHIDRFAASSIAIREIRSETLRHPRLLFVIPDNNNTAGTVEEGIMKGVSDFPTWRIGSGRRYLEIISPGLSFAQDDYSLKADTAVIWIDADDAPPITSAMPQIAIRIDSTAICRKWRVETWPWWKKTVHICGPV